MDVRVRTGVVSLLFLLACAGLASAHTCALWAQFDARSQRTVEDYHRLGIIKLWFYNYCRFQPAKLPDGTITYLDDGTRKQIETFGKQFAGSGISLVPVLSFYYLASREVSQVTRWDTQPTRYRCFSSDQQDVLSGLRELVELCGQYSCFDEICLADEPGVPLGGCVCAFCREAYRTATGREPPPLSAYAFPGAIVSPDHPVLRWARFQEAQMRRFFTAEAAAIRAANSDLEVSLIPASGYYGGAHLTLPGGTPEQMLATGRRINLDPAIYRRFQCFLQFCFMRVGESGWTECTADGLLLSMMPDGQVPQHCTLPVYDTLPGERRLSPVAFRRCILQTFAEGAPAIIYFPGPDLDVTRQETALDTYMRYLRPACANTPELRPLPGRVAVLYSSTTRAFAEVFRANPLERYRQLHACDAVSYYFRQRGVPCDTLLEDELPAPRALRQYRLIVAPALTSISTEAAAILRQYLRSGGRIVLDSTSPVRLAGARVLPLDALAWYRAIEGGMQHVSDLEYQAGLLESVLGPEVGEGLAPCRSESRQVMVNYLTDGEMLYVAAVNHALDATVSTTLRLDQRYRVRNVLTGEDLGALSSIPVSVERGGMVLLALRPRR